MTECVESQYNHQWWITFDKEHWIIEVKAYVVDLKSCNIIMMSFLDMIWEKFSKCLGFGFLTDEEKDEGLLSCQISQLPYDSG